MSGYYLYVAFQERSLLVSFLEKRKDLCDEELVLLSMTQDQYQKAKVDDHELRWNGFMYDIVRIERENGLLNIYAWHDKEEGELLAALYLLFTTSEEDDQSELPPIVLKLISMTFIVPAHFIQARSENNFVFHRCDQQLPDSVYLEFTVPPPRFS